MTAGRRERRSVHALLALSLCIIAGAQPAEVRGQTSLQVLAQKKAGGPWERHATTTLRDVVGPSLPAEDRELNNYGGRTDRTASSTGFFTVRKIGERWWFVDPAGGLYINRAVVSVTIGKSKRAEEAARARFGTMQQWADSTAGMLAGNGFNGLGAWSDDQLMRAARPRLPYATVVNFMSGYGKKRGGTYQQPGHTGYPGECIFVFDPGFVDYCDARAAELTEVKEDPYLIGYFTDNELPFPADALDRFLRLEASDPGCQAAREWLMGRKGSADTSLISGADREAFLELVADRYFAITSRAIRTHDPNHLLLGARFHGKILAQSPVFTAAGRHVDVVSVNYYNTWTPDSVRMAQWVGWSGKPILITEWYVKGADAGLGNTSGAGWIVGTQEDRGLFYQHFALHLLRFKGCVGWHWFKFMDNDPEATGVDPSNTDANKGIVSIQGEPYGPLLEKMKELNRRVYGLVENVDACRTQVEGHNSK